MPKDLFDRRALKWLVWVAPPVLALLAIGVWAWQSRAPANDVLFIEDGLEIDMTTRGDALRRAEQRSGFQGVIPSGLPFEHPRLVSVTSVLPPFERAPAPAISFRFADAELLVAAVVQSAHRTEQPSSGVVFLKTDLDGMVAWRSEHVPQWVATYRGFTVSIVVFVEPPADDEIVTLLRDQLVELDRRNN